MSFSLPTPCPGRDALVPPAPHALRGLPTLLGITGSQAPIPSQFRGFDPRWRGNGKARGRARERATAERRIGEALEGITAAIRSGCSIWLAATIAFQRIAPRFNTPSGSRRLLAQLHRDIATWLRRRGLPLVRLTGLEASVLEGVHAHLTLAVPPQYAKPLRAYIEARVARLAQVESLRPGTIRWEGRYKIRTADQILGWARYGMKSQVPPGEVMAGVRGPQPRGHGGLVAIPGQTLMVSFKPKAGEGAAVRRRKGLNAAHPDQRQEVCVGTRSPVPRTSKGWGLRKTGHRGARREATETLRGASARPTKADAAQVLGEVTDISRPGACSAGLAQRDQGHLHLRAKPAGGGSTTVPGTAAAIARRPQGYASCTRSLAAAQASTAEVPGRRVQVTKRRKSPRHRR